MARKEVTCYYDDIDGTELDQENVNVVRLGYNGATYRLDLSDDNNRKLQELLRPYISAGHREPIALRRSLRSPHQQASKSAVIRQWALDKGMEVNTRGKLPARIIDAYIAEHNK